VLYGGLAIGYLQFSTPLISPEFGVKWNGKFQASSHMADFLGNHPPPWGYPGIHQELCHWNKRGSYHLGDSKVCKSSVLGIPITQEITKVLSVMSMYTYTHIHFLLCHNITELFNVIKGIDEKPIIYLIVKDTMLFSKVRNRTIHQLVFSIVLEV
jgi:hypothetical protein